MVKITYVYSRDDLLRFPQNYQMTTFHGRDFLYEYIKSRTDMIKILEKKNCILEEVEIINGLIETTPHDYSIGLEQQKINTRDILSFILIQLKNQKETSEINKIIDVFVKKFEIKKKIFSSYDAEFKESSEDFTNLLNYILLSSICLFRYEKTFNLKYINVSLKLNDTICSQICSLNDKLDCSLCVHNLKNELIHVSNLCRSKGINL